MAAEEACGESAGDGGVRKRARAAVPPQKTVRVYARAHTSRPSRRTFSFARASLAILHAAVRFYLCYLL